MRELVHAVQLARKNAGLRIEDTIDLTLDLPDDLAAVLGRHEAYVKAETLASGLACGPAAAGSAAAGPAPTPRRPRSRAARSASASSPTGTIFTTPYG